MRRLYSHHDDPPGQFEVVVAGVDLDQPRHDEKRPAQVEQHQQHDVTHGEDDVEGVTVDEDIGRRVL